MSHPPTESSAAPVPAAIAAIFERLAPSLELVERALREQLQGESALVVTLGDHVLSSGGKRLRPALHMLCAELCGYTGPRRVQIAAALELLHTATLLHDDVVDFSDLRRGRPSANALWGNRRAVLAGDFFYARASSMIVDDGNIGILEIFADAIRGMAEGELLQLQSSFDVDVTEAHYYKVIDRKSATLLQASCETGAVLGGVTRAERRSIAEFGHELGLAFQLRDDALDYESSDGVLGKRACADLREGKVTLPLLLALKRCSGSEREQAAGVLKRARDAELREEDVADEELLPVVELVDRYHGAVDTDRRADEHVARARDAIAAFPECDAKASLLCAADYAAARDH